MKKRRPFSWVVEEYAFGAVALRDEIKRHKTEDTEQWSVLKNIAIRLLYVYAIIVTVVLVGIGMLHNWWCDLRK